MDSKEFVSYLEKKGGAEALWKVLVELDQRKNDVEDAVAFIRLNIDKDLTENYEILHKQIDETKQELSKLAEDNPAVYAKFLKSKKRKGKKGKKGNK